MAGMLRGLPIAVLLCAAVIACGSAPAEHAVAVRDSAGIRIVTNTLGDEPSWPTCAVADTPSVDIGSATGDTLYELFQTRDATRMPDGRIAVVSRGSHDLRLFDAAGRHLKTVGRNGEGPREFRDPIVVKVLAPDTLLVWDRVLQRLSLFSNDGTLARIVRFQPAILNVSGFYVSTGDDPFLTTSRVFAVPRANEAIPQILQVLRYDRDGTLMDTLVELSNGTVQMIDRTAGFVGSPTFQARPALATRGGHVYVSHGAPPEIEIRDGGWRLHGLIRWSAPDRTVTDAEVAEYRRVRLEGVSNPEFRRLLQEQDEKVPVEPEFPALRDVQTDPRGWLWAMRYRRPTWAATSWLGFDDTGRFACAASVPKEVEVLEFGADYVLGLWTDESSGIEHVRTYALGGPET